MHDTVICKKYLENIGSALRAELNTDDRYQLKDMPDAFAAITTPSTKVVDNPAGKTWEYEGKAYTLVQHYYDLTKLDTLTDAEKADHGNYYAETVDSSTLVPKRIEVSTMPKKRFYSIVRGAATTAFHADGMKVSAVYGNGTTKEITDYKLSVSDGANFTTDDAGEAEIEVKYSVCGLDYATSFYVEVRDLNNNCIVDGHTFTKMADSIRKNRKTKRHYRVAEMSVFPFLTKEEERDRVHDVSEVITDKDKAYYCQIDTYPKKYYYEYTDEDDEVTLDYSGLSVGFYEIGTEITRTDVTSSCVISPAAGTLRLTESDAGSYEVTVSYTDNDGNAYEMYFEIAFVYLETDIRPPVDMYIEKLPDNVFYTIPKGAASVPVDHSGLKIVAVWEAPGATTAEKKERLKGKYLKRYPDMYEVTSNGVDYLVRDVTDECTIDPATGGLLFDREGTGEYTLIVNAYWVDDVAFNQFRVSFHIYLDDQNPDEEKEEEEKTWKDPQEEFNEEHTIHYDPVIESKTWRDPVTDTTYVTSYDEYGNTSTSSWSGDEDAHLKSIKYTKSVEGALGTVGDTWDFNKYFEVTGTYSDGTSKVLKEGEDFAFSIKDGTVWTKPGVYFQTATSTENKNLTCSKRIRISDIDKMFDDSLKGCVKDFIKHTRESNSDPSIDYTNCNWYVWFDEDDLLNVFCGKGRIVTAKVFCDAHIPDNGKYYGKDLSKPVGIMDKGETVKIGETEKRAVRCIWYIVSTADYEGAHTYSWLYGQGDIPKFPHWKQGVLQSNWSNYYTPGDGMVWFGWGWWLYEDEKYIRRYDEATDSFSGGYTGASFEYA